MRIPYPAQRARGFLQRVAYNLVRRWIVITQRIVEAAIAQRSQHPAASK